MVSQMTLATLPHLSSVNVVLEISKSYKVGPYYRYKWGYNPYKRPQNWGTEVIKKPYLWGKLTPFVTNRDPPRSRCPQLFFEKHTRFSVRSCETEWLTCSNLRRCETYWYDLHTQLLSKRWTIFYHIVFLCLLAYLSAECISSTSTALNLGCVYTI